MTLLALVRYSKNRRSFVDGNTAQRCAEVNAAISVLNSHRISFQCFHKAETVTISRQIDSERSIFVVCRNREDSLVASHSAQRSDARLSSAELTATNIGNR